MKEAENLYNSLIRNWAQVLLVVGGIIFFIQKPYELRLKKKEIKFNKLQENKISEVKTFYKSYQSLFMSLKEYAYQTEFGAHEEEIFTKIKEDIRIKLIEFNYHSMVVKLFIDSKDIETVEKIAENLEKIRFGVSMWHNSRSYTKQDRYDEDLNTIIEEIIPNTLPNLIKDIEKSLRKNFDLK